MSDPTSVRFPEIVRNPGVVGGEPTVKGTRVPVRSLVIHYRLHGHLARISEAFPRVTRQQAEQALVYYEEHRDEIDGYIAENELDTP